MAPLSSECCSDLGEGIDKPLIKEDKELDGHEGIFLRRCRFVDHDQGPTRLDRLNKEESRSFGYQGALSWESEVVNQGLVGTIKA